MENQQELASDEVLSQFCSVFRKQLKLSGFSLRVTKRASDPQILITSPTGNQWLVAYMDIAKRDYGYLLVVSVACSTSIKVEESTASAHFRHSYNSLNSG